MKNAIPKLTVLALITLLSTNLIVFPQSPNVNLSGQVMDKTGGSISQARLTLTNLETKAERKIETNDDGGFVFLAVPPGVYDLLVEKEGFSKTPMKKIVVSIGGQTEQLNIFMQVGEISATMPVSAGLGGNGIDIPPVTRVCCSTDEPSIKDTVPHEKIVGLPSLTRNVYELVALSSGATPSGEPRGVGLSVNGQRGASGNYILDGGENNNLFVAGAAQNLAADSVKEFVVITNNYTAEYGRNAGFIANIVSNTGTNLFHGSAYDFIRDSSLAANSFNNNAQGRDAQGKENAPRPNFNRHQFGGTFSGPLKKDKLFFFTTLEPILVRSTGTAQFFVPTQDLLNLSSAGTRAIFERAGQLFKDKTNLPLPAGNASSLVFDICPAGSLDIATGECRGALAMGVKAYNLVSVLTPGNFGAGSPQNSFLAAERIDYNLTDKTQIFGRYSLEWQDIFPTANQPYTKDLYQSREVRSQNIHLNLTKIWTSRFVTESRTVYNRTRDEVPPTAKVGEANFFPKFTGPVGSLPFGDDGEFGVQNLYQFYQTGSFNFRDHLFKFGGQYVHARDTRIPPVLSQVPTAFFPNIDFFVGGLIAQYTLGIDPQGAKIGDTITPSSPGAIKRHYRYNETSVFFQDTWKAHPRLTISPGLRWEYFGVLHSASTEKQLDANFYYGEGNTLYEKIRNGQFRRTMDNTGDLRNRFYKPDYTNFAPRLGIAFDVFGDGKTVFRSGIGVFYDRNFGNVLSNVSVNPPTFALVSLATLLTPAMVANPYALGSISLTNLSARHLDENLKTAFSVSVNASLEHKFGQALAVGLTYVGSSGSRLYSLNNINKEGTGSLLTGTQVDDRDGLVKGIAEINTRGNLAYSSYHSLQLRIETGRIKNLGLQFGANYTWSHSIDNASSVFYDDVTANPVGFGFLDYFNPGLDRGDSDFDTRHRLVTNFLWDLPFGQNLKNGFARTLVGGWGVSGIFTYQSGRPFSVFDSSALGYTGNESPRPLATGTVARTSLTPDAAIPNRFLYLNLTNFAPLGSAGGPFDGAISRNIFRQPGTMYHNLALTKNFSLPKIFGREGIKLQLRGEFYNAFNHANLFVDAGTNDIAINSFNSGRDSVAGNGPKPAVTVRRGNRVGESGLPGLDSFVDNRQVVIAAKLIF